MTDSAPEAATRQPKLSEPIPLSEPILRGETKITELVLRKPKAGELRDINVKDLLESNASAVLALIPRISMPPLTPQEAGDLELEDFAACAGEIVHFFLTAEERAQAAEMLKQS